MKDEEFDTYYNNELKFNSGHLLIHNDRWILDSGSSVRAIVDYDAPQTQLLNAA